MLYLLDIFPVILITHLGCHHVQEFLKVDASALVLVDVRDHLEDGLVLGLKAQALHSCLELLGVNRARAVGIEQVERLADLLDLLLAQTRTLDLLRRPLPASSLGFRSHSSPTE
jgi:hypothetical protein